MPYLSHQRHRQPYVSLPESDRRLKDVELLLSTIRDLPLERATKKRMLHHALWLVVELTGNFYSRYRSAGVIAAVGVPIQRDHIHPRKLLVAEVLEGKVDLSCVVERARCCIVTKEEHCLLSGVGANVQGFERYDRAGVTYHDMTIYVPAYPTV